jgi:hypothetical protein
MPAAVSVHGMNPVVFADAFQALRILPKQLAVLQASEEETRQVRLGATGKQHRACSWVGVNSLTHMCANEAISSPPFVHRARSSGAP